MQKSIKPAKGRWFCFPPARHPRGGNWWPRGEKGLEITWRKEIQTWKRWSSSSSRKKDIMEIGYLALGRCYPMVIVSGRVRTERNCGISPSKAQDLILTQKILGGKRPYPNIYKTTPIRSKLVIFATRTNQSPNHWEAEGDRRKAEDWSLGD